MDDQEEGSFSKELGRLPEGHLQLLGAMPKPDVEQAANYSLTRLAVLFVIALGIAAVLIVVLPAIIWPG